MVQSRIMPLKIRVKYANACSACGAEINIGEIALWDRFRKSIRHIKCENNRNAVMYNGHIAVKFEKNFALISQLKEIGRVSWLQKELMWLAAPTPIQANPLIEFLTQNKFHVEPEASKLLLSLQTVANYNFIRSSSKVTDFVPNGIKGTPDIYQNVATEAAILNKKVLIGDDMGTGKSLEALGVVSHLDLSPIVIVCPAVAKWTWQDEINKWTNYSSMVLSGTKEHPLTSTRIILNYDILGDWLDTLLELDPALIIFDEMHYLRNFKTKRARAAVKLAKKRDYVLGLSGTPIINGPKELINIFRILEVLEDFGGFKYWMENYADATPTKLIEVNNKLRWSGIYIRRNAEDVLEKREKPVRQRLLVDIDNRPEYNRAEADLAKWVAEHRITDEEWLETLAALPEEEQEYYNQEKYRQVFKNTERFEHLVKWNALGQLAAIGKSNQIVEWIQDFLETGNKLTVFSYYRAMQSKLMEAFPNALHILSKDTPLQRAQAVKQFQEGDNQLIVVSLKVGNVNITLTAGHHNVTTDLGWTPADHEQAEARQDRKGQKFRVWSGYFVGRDTIDIDRFDIIDGKAPRVSAVIKGTDQVDLMETLSLRLLEKYKI